MSFRSIRVGEYLEGNYIEIGPDGYMQMYGTATTWEDLRVPVTATKAGGTKDPDFAVAIDNGAGSQGVFVQWFDDATEEELYFAVQLPHSWKEGSDIEPHVHWIPAANGTDGQRVRWGFEYTWASVGGVFGNTNIIYTTDILPDDTNLVANTHYLSDMASIDATGQTYSSMLLCRIFRDATNAADDYTDDAGLLEIDFHYEIDSYGTNSEYD